MINKDEAVKSRIPNQINQDSICALVGKGVFVKGPIEAVPGKTVLINGVLDGSIFNAGAVLIGAGAIVRGSVVAETIYLNGEISRGDDPESTVKASSLILVGKEGKLTATTLIYGELEFDYGASIDAKMHPLLGKTRLEDPFDSLKSNADFSTEEFQTHQSYAAPLVEEKANQLVADEVDLADVAAPSATLRDILSNAAPVNSATIGPDTRQSSLHVRDLRITLPEREPLEPKPSILSFLKA